MKRSYLVNWLMASVVLCNGCQNFKLWDGKKKSPADDDEEQTKTTYVADQVNIAGLTPITIEGVGLVKNLDNTGEDPPPSMWRTMLMEDMKRRGFKNPHTILQSPTTTLVLIRAAVPPVVQHGDRFDIEVVLPDGSNATSLAGGWLMEADLAERAIVPGREPAKGHILAKCQGPILLSMGEGDKSSLPSLMKRGKVLGGAVFVGGLLKEDRKLGLYLRNDLRSARQAKRIADRIGMRFHHHVKGIKKPLTNAKTDQHIELEIHPRYKDNYIRYLQVIRRITMNESPVDQRRRVERLRKQLLDPQTASLASTELEAIGKETIPILKEGLQSPSDEVRFYAADALAYLEDSSGVDVLVKMAREEEAFRVFALASLANLEGIANEYLRELMNESSAETRYGAFHALHSLDKNDSFLAKERIGEQFNLYVLRTKGEPMVHLTKHRVPEVVLFGADQRLQPPFALSAGRHILVSAAAGSEVVTVSRFEAGKPDRKKSVSLRLADVLRAIGELGASYPDAAQLLTQAERTSNLQGRLKFDALPQAGRIYHRPAGNEGLALGKSRKSSTKIGKESMSPNLFPKLDDLKSFTDDLDESSTGAASSTNGRPAEGNRAARQGNNVPGNNQSDRSAAKPNDDAGTDGKPELKPADERAAASSGQTEPAPADDTLLKKPAAKKPGMLARLFPSKSDQSPDSGKKPSAETTSDPFPESP
jgi:flagellar basal body P-ring protein FlgI